MRSIWKGAISFGLVTIPVKLYSATEERDVAFHQVHRADGGRIRYKRVCSVDGTEVSYADIAKGYELPTGETVVLIDEDFAQLPLTTSRAIDVLQFVPLEAVDPIYFSKSYYLEPEAAGTKPYVLLRDALEQSGKVAIVKVALRQRESLATLRVRDGVFVLEVMLWPDEIRTPSFGFLDEDVEVRPQELAMAGSLIETLSGDFDPTAYTDRYREALQALIEAKVAGREVVAAQPGEQPGVVVDLMAALRASVEAAKAGREAASEPGGADAAAAPPEEGAAAAEPAKPRARKRAAPAKKTAAPRDEAETRSVEAGSAAEGAAADSPRKQTPRKVSGEKNVKKKEPAKPAKTA
ncbi:MAG TPA: Ku protein [Mycobacteriales bacterium]|nr:Ku protein [Mycobacteriales bacterium]